MTVPSPDDVGVPLADVHKVPLARVHYEAGLPGAGFAPGAERALILALRGTRLELNATIDRARDWLVTLQGQSAWANEQPAILCAVGTSLAALGDDHATERVWRVASELPTSSVSLRMWIAILRARSFLAHSELGLVREELTVATDLARWAPLAVGADVCVRAAMVALLSGDDALARWWAEREVADGSAAARSQQAAVALLLNAETGASSVVQGTSSGAWDLPDQAVETVLISAEALVRAGEPVQARALLTSQALPGSLVLRALWLRLTATVAAVCGDEELASWVGTEQARVAAQREMALGAVLRRDAAEGGDGFFDVLGDFARQQWQQHSAGLSALVDHDLRGLTQTAELALCALDDHLGQAELREESIAMLTAAVAGIVRVSGTVPLLATDAWSVFGASAVAAESGHVEQGAGGSVAVTTDLEELADSLRIRLKGADQNLRLEMTGVAALRWSRTTANGVAVILDNLVRNASSASADGSLIRVRVSPYGADSVELEVIDQGEGFDPGLGADIFRRGSRAGDQRSLKTARGLGLFTVALVTARLGGSVVAESPAGAPGATFRVRVPAR